MSQNGRREFLTSAAAVAAALAACTAPARRAQAQACGAMYKEQDIVSKVAPYVHDTVFRKELITFTAPGPTGASPTMANLTQKLVDKTLAALTGKGVTTVIVLNTTNLPPGTNLPLGEYELVSWETTPGPGKRWPVVLTLTQEAAGSFKPDWSKILLFVIPDPKGSGGQDITTAGARSKMCTHPFGM
jgi:hypothetical protein